MNLLTDLADKVAPTELFADFDAELIQLEENYLPSYPPMSPMTVTYYHQHCYFDFTFGNNKETFGSIFAHVVKVNKPDKCLLAALENFNNSHLGFYHVIRKEEEYTLVEDIITGNRYPIVVPSGYEGNKGEIWLCRILPPLDTAYVHHIVVNTPYIIRATSKQDWLDYFERRGIHHTKKGYEKAYIGFMKNNPYPNFWPEYLLDGYFNYQSGCIFLTGIPDIKTSLPNRI